MAALTCRSAVASSAAFHCRHRDLPGHISASALQSFLADRVLGLPQVPSVTPSSLARLLRCAPHHKVVAVALAEGPGPASLALRSAAQRHGGSIATARGVLRPQVCWQ